MYACNRNKISTNLEYILQRETVIYEIFESIVHFYAEYICKQNVENRTFNEKKTVPSKNARYTLLKNTAGPQTIVNYYYTIFHSGLRYFNAFDLTLIGYFRLRIERYKKTKHWQYFLINENW